jgi:hypothetical protein
MAPLYQESTKVHPYRSTARIVRGLPPRHTKVFEAYDPHYENARDNTSCGGDSSQYGGSQKRSATRIAPQDLEYYQSDWSESGIGSPKESQLYEPDQRRYNEVETRLSEIFNVDDQQHNPCK